MGCGIAFVATYVSGRYTPTVRIQTEYPFDKIHSDLSGCFNTPTLGENEYYMTFVDDYMCNDPLVSGQYLQQVTT